MAAVAEQHVESGAMTPRSFCVANRRRETQDTWTLELEPVAGEPLDIRPGQFTMLYAFGVGEVPVSVSGLGAPLVQTVRAVGAVTRAVCAAEPGRVLGVRGPYGNGWPLVEAAGGDLLIVAGGIGLAPLRGALLHALEHRSHYGELALLYGGRTPGELLYRDWLEALSERADVQLGLTVDAAEAGWHGNVGVAPKLVEEARFDPDQAVAFVVGPEIMMRFTIDALLGRGVPLERIYVSLERNMRCGLGHCGHCQLGPTLICRDGPIYSAAEVAALMEVREL